jgi:hypothetical protein
MFKNLIVVILLISFSPIIALSFSGNGSGTEEDPYQITNVTQLQEMEDDLDANYVLMNDIDASDTENWNSGKGFDPIGFDYDNPFTGTLDGYCYTIDGLYINRPDEDYVGLFGYIQISGNNLNDIELQNINITNAYLKGNKYIGVLLGYFWFEPNTSPTCSIKNCNVFGRVLSDSDDINSEIGGLVGFLKCATGSRDLLVSIENCTTKVEIESNNRYCGGLIGELSVNGKFSCSDCISEGKIESTRTRIGGLIGYVSTRSVSSSYIELKNCLSKCDVFSSSHSGGFIGFLECPFGTISVMNCCSYGDVTFTSKKSGGFIGYLDNSYGNVSFENCFCTGTVYDNSPLFDAGGFVGFCSGNHTFSCCFWQENNAEYDIDDFNNTPDYDHPDIYKKTQEEMQSYSTFGSCFDFVDDWIMGNDVMPRDNLYPIQRSLVPTGSIIPTLTEWAVIAFISLLGGIGGWFVWERGGNESLYPDKY